MSCCYHFVLIVNKSLVLNQTLVRLASPTARRDTYTSEVTIPISNTGSYFFRRLISQTSYISRKLSVTRIGPRSPTYPYGVPGLVMTLLTVEILGKLRQVNFCTRGASYNRKTLGDIELSSCSCSLAFP